jgi:hypothetical protein
MRVKLCEKYADEREEICKKIIDILELDENHSFLLSELDDNLEKQNELLALKDDINKCFAVSKISTFKPNFECKRPYLNLARSILRKQGYTFISTNCEIKINNVLKKTQRYVVFRKID